MNWLGDIVQRHVTSSDTLLDLGCGIMFPSDEVTCKAIVGVDVFPRYLEHIRDRCCTIRLGLDETDRFADNSYDVVICLDVLEHLDKPLAITVLRECIRICRKFAIVFTPVEFSDNEQEEEGAWGLGPNEYQRHVCLITSTDLSYHGYKVTEINDGLLGVFSK